MVVRVTRRGHLGLNNNDDVIEVVDLLLFWGKLSYDAFLF